MALIEVFRGEAIQVTSKGKTDAGAAIDFSTGYTLACYLSTDSDGGADNTDDTDMSPTTDSDGNVTIDFDTSSLTAGTAYYFQALATQDSSGNDYFWPRNDVTVTEPVTKPA